LTKIRNKKCAIASHQKLQNKEEMKNLNKWRDTALSGNEDSVSAEC
jgi:hypothetical protein